MPSLPGRTDALPDAISFKPRWLCHRRKQTYWILLRIDGGTNCSLRQRKRATRSVSHQSRDKTELTPSLALVLSHANHTISVYASLAWVRHNLLGSINRVSHGEPIMMQLICMVVLVKASFSQHAALSEHFLLKAFLSQPQIFELGPSADGHVTLQTAGHYQSSNDVYFQPRFRKPRSIKEFIFRALRATRLMVSSRWRRLHSFSTAEVVIAGL